MHAGSFEDENYAYCASVRYFSSEPASINSQRFILNHVVDFGAFLNIFFGCLYGNFMTVSHSVHAGELSCAIGMNRVYFSRCVSTGNPNLKPTKANNYDLLIEHFFQPLGILQAGFFYKQLSNPIYPTAFNLTSGPEAGFLLTQSINGPNAHIAEFEAAWEQRLSWLPGLLNGFGVSANYSYTTSQVTFPDNFSNGRDDHPTLRRQAPNNWNFGLTYDKARFSGRFAITHNDANLFQYAYQANGSPNDPILGLKGPTGDIYLYAHTQFDVQGSYRIYKGLSFFGYGLNLSNEFFGFYQGSPKYPIQREYYHPTVAFGMRWSSGSEQ
jgi:TonB-dependent receptor